MRLLNKYKKGVIIVYSMPRSGTTILGRYLESKLKIPNAAEIFHKTNKNARKHALSVLNKVNKTNGDFICKYFPTNDTFDDTVFGNRTEFYRVNLVRRNIAKQFTSLYIALQTNIWQTHSFGELKSDTTRKRLKVDTEIIDSLFNKFIFELSLKEKFDKKTTYDETIYYEDIVGYLNKTKTSNITNVESIKPINYNSIYADAVSRLIKYRTHNIDTAPDIVHQWYNNFQKNGFRVE